MMRLAMSPAASGLLRGLIRRGGCSRNRILLIEHRSVEWQSLTFLGERHQLVLRIAAPDAAHIAGRMSAREASRSSCAPLASSAPISA